jgi:linoleoyl-CoA desaturase
MLAEGCAMNEQKMPLHEPEIGKFTHILSQRIHQFFRENDLPNKADAAMYLKIAMGFAYWIASYFLLCFGQFGDLGFAVVYAVHGFSHVFLILNVGHDANHHAISQNATVNRALSYTMDLCGINSYMWRILHHSAHHYCVNVHTEDETIDGRGLLRLSPCTSKRWYHKYQYLYGPIVYSFYSLDYVFVKDFRFFAFPTPNMLKFTPHPTREWIILAAAKLAYVGYMIGVPIAIGRSAPIVLASFLVAHLLMGLCVLLLIQTSHALPDNAFPDGAGKRQGFAAHILATTQDCAPRNAVLSWLAGGLNRHVIHHLYPNISHTHYGVLTQILKRVTEEVGAPYHQIGSFHEALRQHFVLLKRLGS